MLMHTSSVLARGEDDKIANSIIAPITANLCIAWWSLELVTTWRGQFVS